MLLPMTEREQRIWDATYAEAFVIYTIQKKSALVGDVGHASVVADAAITLLRQFIEDNHDVPFAGGLEHFRRVANEKKKTKLKRVTTNDGL